MKESDVALSLRETHQKIKQMLAIKISEYDINFGMLFLTMKIDKNPDASQKELAEQMKFTQGTMSNVVKRLIKQNVIQQIPLESDTRYNRLVVTDLGRSILEDYEKYVVDNYEKMFYGLDDDELYKFYNALSKINTNLDKIISNNKSIEIIQKKGD